jgi:hypothetical protein
MSDERQQICKNCNEIEEVDGLGRIEMTVSTCCNVKVLVEGNTTKYYVCSKCGNPCNIKEEE